MMADEREVWRIIDNPPDGGWVACRIVGGEGLETRPIASFMHRKDAEAIIEYRDTALNRAALTDALVERLRAASERAHVSRMHADPYSYCNAAGCIADRALMARYEAARGGA